MKSLSDGYLVNDRTYYYLLDFNDSDGWQFMIREFGEMSLSKLKIAEYHKLLKHAFESDLKQVSNER
jgi:hypothetical protein